MNYELSIMNTIINWTYMKWRRISRATKLLSRIFKILKILKKNPKKYPFFFFSRQFPPKSKFSKNRDICQRVMSHEYVYKMSSRYLQKWLIYNIKHVKNWRFSRHFGTLPWFSEFRFLTDFDASKSILGLFFAFFAKIWPKNMYCSSISRFFLFDLFHLVTWDDLDLYYGHKAQEMILTDVSDTIHADSLALFALNIEILLADVTKPEKSKILTLTWPVTSSVTSGSNFWPCTGSSRTGLSNGVWNLEIGPVVWEISGGALCPPPPAGRVTNQTPAGRGIGQRYS